MNIRDHIHYLLIRAHTRKAQRAISRHPEHKADIIDALFSQRPIPHVFRPFPLPVTSITTNRR